MNAESWAARATACHREGRLEEAVEAYRALLALQPGLAAAHSNLGAALKDLGRLDDAVAAYRCAIAADPTHVPALANLGEALLKTGAAQEALALCLRAAELAPTSPEIHNSLGVALTETGHLDAAVSALRWAVTLMPGYADGWFNLAVAERARGALAEALEALAQVVVLRPGHVDGHLVMASILRSRGERDAAEASCHRALALAPDHAEAWFLLGSLLLDRESHADAASALARCLSVAPGHADALANLGSALLGLGRFGEAIAAYRRSVELAPARSWLHHNLAIAYRKVSDVRNEVAELRTAVALDPADAELHSTLLVRQICLPDLGLDQMLADLECWRGRHGQTHLPAVALANSPDPDRRLRVGYVSNCLNWLGDIPRGLWLSVLPMLRHHDSDAVEVFIYGRTTFDPAHLGDAWPMARAWRSLAGLDDESAAAQIRADGIDILVCLLGHTDGDPMTLFTHRPAPVQVSHCNLFTSGIVDMDYFITDDCSHPPASREYFAETAIRIPHLFSFVPLDWAPETSPLPALAADGEITFSCFNVREKISDPSLAAFTRVLAAVPKSRLLLKCRNDSYLSEATRAATLDLFVRGGISPDRVHFLPRTPSGRDHLAAYRAIDFALDPFPHQGCLTSYDALWMGVPVVALDGDRVAHRWGQTMLHAAGLDDLIAATEDEYVAKVVALVSDLDALAALRASLRRRMRQSPLCDAAGFTRTLEGAYRQMWHRWCARTP